MPLRLLQSMFPSHYPRQDVGRALGLINNALLIDVGASHFLHPPWLNLTTRAKVDYVAIDPDSSSLDYLEHQEVRGILHKRVVAVGPVGGEVDFFVANVKTGSSLLEPVVSSAMQWRLTENPPRVFPVAKQSLEVVRLEDAIAPLECHQPRLIKLDTQGSELRILQSVDPWFSQRLVIGVEVEASLLAEPLYRGSPRFHEVQAWLESQGFELLRIQITEAEVPGRAGGRSYPRECDAVFALRHDIAIQLDAGSQALLFGLYLSHALFHEAGLLYRHSQDLRDWFLDRVSTERIVNSENFLYRLSSLGK